MSNFKLLHSALQIHKSLILLIIIVLLGGFLRFYRLGRLPIEGDNSFHALAAKGILEYGVPKMPSGQLYLRAVPLLYLEAASLRIFGDSEWSLRFPNALIGVLNIILVYFLALTITGNNVVAFVATLFFSVSPWAIATSRMPRMYETLTMTTLLSWIFFYLWYYRQKTMFLPPLLAITFIALSLHKLAILAMLCFLVPLLLERRFTIRIITSTLCFLALTTLWYFFQDITLYILSNIQT
jgi:4-amino-4-deoxy-L-arabinose transferase-like glycosyltransferase